METAEIHSMSMEFFTEKWMNLFFGNRAQDYVEMHLEDAAAPNTSNSWFSIMKSKNSAVSGDSSRYIFWPAAMISSGVPVGAGLPSLKYTCSSI